MDQGFKTVIHDINILSWLLHENVDELKGKSIDEIKTCLEIGEDGRTVIGRENDYFSMDSGSIIPDSVFDVTIPGTGEAISVIVNIEGQNDPIPDYPLEKRAEYYLARMVSSQKGRDFSGDDYGKIRKVYSIWLILDPRARYRNTAVRYRMRAENLAGDPKRVIPPLETFNLLIINVGRYDSNLPDISAFPAALFSMMTSDERRDLMMDRFNIELDDVLNRGVGELASIGQDTWNKGYREGREESIKGYSETAAFLVREKGFTLEEAIQSIQSPPGMKPRIEEETRRILGN